MSDAAARIRALTEAATSAPWTISQQFPRGIDARGQAVTTTERVGKGVADAALIVALRNAAEEIADLIQEAKHARELIGSAMAQDWAAGVPVNCDYASVDVVLGEALAAVEAKFGEPA